MEKHSRPNEFNASLEKETHLLDYFNVFRRRWKIALLIFLLIFTGASIYILNLTPIYAASTTLTVIEKPAGDNMEEF